MITVPAGIRVLVATKPVDFSRDSPDDSQTGVNIRAFPAFPQDRREAQMATGTTGGPNGSRGV